jgi:ABC-2 type transport system ATP-binding protein
LSANQYVIQTQDLGKRFGSTWAVQGLTLTVPRGQIFCLLGPSGSGKTTTLRMMLGVYKPTTGTLNVLGRPPLALGGMLHQRIGYLPQHFVLYPTLSVQENLNFVGMLYGLGLFQRRRRIRELLEFLELWPARHSLASRISGGMLRRLSLAAALLHKPELLFLDEPTAGIDPILRAKLWDEFRRLQRARTTLIVTTQYVTEAEYGDEIAILDEGRLAAMGTPEQLRQQALGGEEVVVHTSGPTGFGPELYRKLKAQDGVAEVAFPSYDLIRLAVHDSASAVPNILSILQSQGVQVESVENVTTSFDDVFVRLVQMHQQRSSAA